MDEGASGKARPATGVDGAADGLGVLDGTYRLERELSRGGMGRIYVATHVHLGSQVAIKLLRDDRADGAATDPAGSSRADHDRFLQEARAAAQLRHPNVVQVLDFGVDHDRPYLVMELLAGESLRARLDRDGALGPADTAAIVTAIARALTAAHAAGIVHRDLKPDNVFLAAADGAMVVKVLDFGVAKVAASAAVVTTVTGAVMGTPAYMSPEQTQGARDVDSASDRWALGVIGFEALLGRRPFDAESAGELVLQICAWALPVPSHVGPVPAGFDAWFATACARDRDHRFASADEQARALAAICSAAGATARGPAPTPAPHRVVDGLAPTVAPPRRPARARPFRLALAGAGAGAILALLWWRWPVARTTTPPAPPQAGAALVPTSAAPPLRIAVLPRDDSGPAELAPLVDSITDELITRLAGRAGVRVIARASVMRLRGQPRPELARTAAELGADRLLIAQLTPGTAGLRLSLELIDARDQTVAWTQTYARPRDELEGVCALAATDLAAALGAPPATARPPRAPAAFRAYRTGRGYWARRDHASLTRAIGFFEEALRLDPDYPEAWVGLVDAYLLLPWMGPTPRAEAYGHARAALDRALALAPDSADVQAARGNVLVEVDWRFAEAALAYRRAIELDPDHASAHQWLAEALAFSRRFDEALAELDLALQLDPLIPALHKIRGRTLYYAGRFADAVAAADRALALDPGHPFASYGKGYALVRLGRFDEGLAAITAEPMMQGPAMRPTLAVQELWVAARRGDHAAVARLRAEIERSALAEHAPFTAAFAAAVVGDREPMYAALERGVATHDPWLPQIALVFEFDPYRAEPRFGTLIGRLGL